MFFQPGTCIIPSFYLTGRDNVPVWGSPSKERCDLITLGENGSYNWSAKHKRKNTDTTSAEPGSSKRKRTELKPTRGGKRVSRGRSRLKKNSEGVSSAPPSSAPPSSLSMPSLLQKVSSAPSPSSSIPFQAPPSAAPASPLAAPASLGLPASPTISMLHGMTEDLSWLTELRQLTTEFPREFDPDVPESDSWLGRANIWLEALAHHWKLPECDISEKKEELLIVSRKEYETEKGVLSGYIILQSLGALGTILKAVVINCPNRVEMGDSLMGLKAWMDLASSLV